MVGETQTTGFAGLGLMGRPMALKLRAAGRALAVWNRSPGKLRPVVEAGAAAAESPAALARAARVVFTCVSDGAAVERVVFGADGVAEGAAPGKLLVDLSSIGVGETRDMAARLERETGMRWVDAPVSGGVPGAERATLAVMAGGGKADVDAVRPLLGAFSRRVTHMGGVGAGQVAKLCNQAIVVCNLAAMAEALALAERAGVDMALLPEALAGGFADSIPLQLFGPRMAAGAFEDPLGRVSTMHKDAVNARRLAEEVDAELPMTRLAATVCRQAIEDGRADADASALIARYRRGAAEGRRCSK